MKRGNMGVRVQANISADISHKVQYRYVFKLHCAPCFTELATRSVNTC